MKIKKIYLLLTAALLPTIGAMADDQKATPVPSKQELREQLKSLPPEERAAKIKELREKHGLQGGPTARKPGPGGPGALDPEKRREEMIKFLKAIGLDPEEVKKLEPDERMKTIREAAEKKIAELKKKKEDGTLTEDEKQLLERLEARRRFFQERRDGGDHPLKPEVEKPAEKKE